MYTSQTARTTAQKKLMGALRRKQNDLNGPSWARGAHNPKAKPCFPGEWSARREEYKQWKPSFEQWIVHTIDTRLLANSSQIPLREIAVQLLPPHLKNNQNKIKSMYNYMSKIVKTRRKILITLGLLNATTLQSRARGTGIKTPQKAVEIIQREYKNAQQEKRPVNGAKIHLEIAQRKAANLQTDSNNGTRFLTNRTIINIIQRMDKARTAKGAKPIRVKFREIYAIHLLEVAEQQARTTTKHERETAKIRQFLLSKGIHNPKKFQSYK